MTGAASARSEPGSIIPAGTPRPLSVQDRMLRAVWAIVSATVFRFSPSPLHGWRRFLLRLFGARIGSGARIYPSVRIWAPWSLSMESGSCLGYNVNCYNCGPVILGQSALVSQDTTLCTGTHDYRVTSFPLITRPIVIGAHAWVCAEAFIAPGVTVGAGAVVGARAFVFRDVAPWSIVSGNPAAVVGHRTLTSGLTASCQTSTDKS
jgi:putative colanic acid biosynthesis acetyltransferase WcaF